MLLIVPVYLTFNFIVLAENSPRRLENESYQINSCNVVVKTANSDSTILTVSQKIWFKRVEFNRNGDIVGGLGLCGLTQTKGSEQVNYTSTLNDNIMTYFISCENGSATSFAVDQTSGRLVHFWSEDPSPGLSIPSDWHPPNRATGPKVTNCPSAIVGKHFISSKEEILGRLAKEPSTNLKHFELEPIRSTSTKQAPNSGNK